MLAVWAGQQGAVPCAQAHRHSSLPSRPSILPFTICSGSQTYPAHSTAMQSNCSAVCTPGEAQAHEPSRAKPSHWRRRRCVKPFESPACLRTFLVMCHTASSHHLHTMKDSGRQILTESSSHCLFQCTHSFNVSQNMSVYCEWNTLAREGERYTKK